ncbi:MAG: CBASS oligonucleotide cyclase [Paracoccaceae bacterium]
MAKTVVQGFQQLKTNLEISNLQISTVSQRQQNVRGVVEAGMTVLDSFLAGSYRRSTMISPLKEADVDIFMVLAVKHYEKTGQGKLLQDLRAVLRKTYTKTPEISQNGQAVTITFTDFKVDVVPTFNRKGGGYLIPDASQKRWISTDPKRHVDIWTARNKQHTGDLVPMIKMLKAWNKSRKVFRSFHLEVLALSVFQGVTISDYPSGARFFFDKARDKIRTKLADPAGYSDDIASHVNTETQFQTIISHLNRAYTDAVQAEQHAALGYEKTAYDKWYEIFRGYFPSYG